MKKGTICRMLLVLVAGCCFAPMALSAEQKVLIDTNALAKLQAMSEYMASLKSFSFQTDEAVDGAVEFDNASAKVQYAAQRTVSVKRPGQFAIDVSGDVTTRKLWMQNNKITILDTQWNEWTAFTTKGEPRETLKALRDKTGMIMPLGALIYGDLRASIEQQADVALYLGERELQGTKCHHLIFRGAGYVWQLWVQGGDRPLPLKFVVTDTSTPSQPQHVVQLRKWKTSARLKDSMFTPKLSKDAKEVEQLQLVFWLPDASKK
jgi:hypothetical protein